MKLISEMNPKLEFLNKELFGSWPPSDIGRRLWWALQLPRASG